MLRSRPLGIICSHFRRSAASNRDRSQTVWFGIRLHLGDTEEATLGRSKAKKAKKAEKWGLDGSG